MASCELLARGVALTIDDELALQWLKELILFVITRRGGEDGADIDLVRKLGNEVLRSHEHKIPRSGRAIQSSERSRASAVRGVPS